MERIGWKVRSPQGIWQTYSNQFESIELRGNFFKDRLRSYYPIVNHYKEV